MTGALGRAPRLVCLDVDGTLTSSVTGPALPGAVEAVARLRERVPVRLVTNTTSRSHGALAAHLMAQGLLDEPASLVTPAILARRVLPGRGHAAGMLLLEPEARADFGWFEERPGGPAVLLGTEAHDRRIADLQEPFRALLDGARLYTLQANRYFMRDGRPVTDLGPVAAFLAFASRAEPEVLGKPSRLLYEELAREVGCGLEEIVMVGDDAEVDVAASIALGMRGVLVRSGKYRAGDEARGTLPPTALLDSVVELPAWLGF